MIPDPQLPVVVVAEHVGRVREAPVARARRHVPAHAHAPEEAVLRLRRDPDRRARQIFRRRHERREREIGPPNLGRAQHRRRVARHHRPVHLAHHAQEIARGKRQPRAPAKGPRRRVEACRLPAPLVAAVAGEFHQLRRFLAHDRVEREIRLPRAHPDVFVAGRNLHEAADGERGRLLTVLRPQVDLRADVQVAHVVAGPVLVDAGIAVDDPAKRGFVDEQRIQVAVDARVEEERPEDLRAILDADAEGAREIADVGVALDPVRSAAIRASGPLAAGQHLGGRHIPQPSVAEEGRRRRSCLLRRGGRRGRCLGGWRTLPRGCP